MTAFFVVTDTACAALITRVVRDHDDIASVAADAEADVIGHYTRQYPSAEYVNQFYVGAGYNKGNDVYVALRGFNPDADLVTDLELKRALQRTIAEVINWRLVRYGENPLLSSVSTAIGVSKSYRADASSMFPPTLWSRRLKEWDLRAPVVVI